MFSNPNNRTFVLYDGDEFAGMSSFITIDQARQVLEIGGTYYRPHLRGSGFNRRVKDMMLKRAFDCGIRRVEFRVDVRNERSQAAMKKLGAVREGVLRADRITWTGHVRDTALFAILKEEWPVSAPRRQEPGTGPRPRRGTSDRWPKSVLCSPLCSSSRRAAAAWSAR